MIIQYVGKLNDPKGDQESESISFPEQISLKRIYETKNYLIKAKTKKNV